MKKQSIVSVKRIRTMIAEERHYAKVSVKSSGNKPFDRGYIAALDFTDALVKRLAVEREDSR